MHIYVVRHAEAVPIGAGDVRRDEDRYLTPKGTKQARRVARLFRGLQMRPGAIWVSPLVRAQQTAAAIARGLKQPPDLVTTDLLAPPGSLGPLLRQIDRCPHEHLVLVGHEPFLGELVYSLATGAAGGDLPLTKGAVACIERASEADPESESRLLWLLPNRLIRTLLPKRKP